MENTGGVKYEQENLLDKFIHNEKKAKLWAAISLLAFFTVATTVIVVAYQIKNSNGQQSSGKDTGVVPEPGKTVVEYQNEITELTNYVQQYKDSMNYLYTVINGYASGTRNADSLLNLLDECRRNSGVKGDPIPLVTTTVVIYTLDASETTKARLMELTQRSENVNNKINVSIQQARERNRPSIRYADSKFARLAEDIANQLNNSNAFTRWNNLFVIPGDRATMNYDIEIWLAYINLTD